MLAAAEAAAHGLGERYDLPLPLWLYLAGAGCAVAVSFAALALGTRAGARPRPRTLAAGTLPAWLVFPAQLLSVALFVLTIAAGLLGQQSPFKNIAPAMVWIVFWVGLGFVCAFVGDVWRLVSPWMVVALWSERLCRMHPLRRLKVRLGAWPAVILFIVFAWGELVWSERDAPRSLALAVIGYSALTWLAMAVFGRERWLRRGEVFAVAFGLIGRFAPLGVARMGRRWRWRLRPYAVGLCTRAPVSVSEMAFVLTMLATVTADGFFETPAWSALVAAALAPDPAAFGAPPGYAQLASAAVLLFPILFAAVYLATAAAMARSLEAGFGVTARRFILSLVPIAIAYHLAHYLSFLLIAGQLVIPLASDPFGFGWDLFGTTLYRIDLSVIDARTVWYVAVAAIVAGHVLAVWLAHRTARRLVADAGTLRRSQIPMMALMVLYTMLSLWILAQPITEPAASGQEPAPPTMWARSSSAMPFDSTCARS